MAKTHVIDGVTYVEVDRKAEAGDLIILNGRVAEFRYTDGIYNFVKYEGAIYGKDAWYVSAGYVVLEPASPDVTDLLANLARRLEVAERRVSSLEEQLRSTQRNLETTAEELEAAKNAGPGWAEIGAINEDVQAIKKLTEAIMDDIVMLDERTNAYDNTSKSGAKLLAEAFTALARYEEARR